MAQNSVSNWPLSGAVNQAFDFMDSWFRTGFSQLGLVNITVGRTADAEVEKEVLQEVGTYGRQLGRIGDVLRILVDRLDQSAMPEEQKKAVRAFINQVDLVDDVKTKRRMRLAER